MTYLKGLLVIFLLLFSSCCNQYSKKSLEPSDNNEQLPANLMKDQNKGKLSPGTAKVISIIMERLKGNNVKIRIKSVLEYGMTTKPIAPGSEMVLYVAQNLKPLLSNRNPGEEINLIILQQNMMNSDSLNWMTVDVLQ